MVPSTTANILRYTKTNPSKVYTAWTRPSDWLTIPSIATGEQVIYLLYGVLDNDSNYMALLCQGNYTVDWGDGTIENISTNVKAQHQYTFSSIPSSTTTSEGYRQVLIKITPQSGQNLTVVNLNQRHSFYSATNIATVLDMVLNIPNVSGANLTISSSSPVVLYARCKRFWVNQIGAINTTNYLLNGFRDLESIPLFDTSSVTNFAYMFYNCYSLQTIPLFNTAAAISFSNMFNSCLSLLTIPLLNSANVTTMDSMFVSCYSLQSVPLLNTSKVTSMANMFLNCGSLQSVPLFDTSNVTGMNTMFYNCSALQSVPNFNTTKVTVMNNMFLNCSSLITAPTLTTSNVTNIGGMFQGCGFLISIPYMDTSKATLMGNMFNGCKSLQYLPNLNTSASTDLSGIFNGCNCLKSIPTFDFSKAASLNSSFFGCSNIQSVDISAPLVTGSNSGNNTFYGCSNIKKIKVYTPLLTDAPGFIIGCSNLTDLEIESSSWATNGLNTVSAGVTTLTRVILTNMKISFNVSNNKLSAKAINDLGNSVANRVGFTSPTVTLTGNPGTATMTTSIWTAKNWTVVI